MSDADKLQAIHERLDRAIMNRVRRCTSYAKELATDMEAVEDRLKKQGKRATISSVRVAKYHIAQTELEVLKRVMDMVESVLVDGRPSGEVDDKHDEEID
jgi:hypothetical protein